MSASSPIPRSLARTILVAIILALKGVCGSAQTDQRIAQPESPPRGQYILKPFRIIGNIYYVGLSDNTSFLITTPQGHILLDPTYEAAVPYISKNIEQLGFQLQDIKIIIQAHAHVDHVEGLAAFKKLTGAKVLVMGQDAEVLADGGKSDFRGDGKLAWPPVRADKILHDGEKVRLGRATMVAHLTAGHSKGCTTWSMVAEENGRKYNVVFACSMRMNTRIPLVGNTKYPTIADDFAKSFKTLKNLPCDVFLVSHGNMFNMAEKIKRWEQDTGTNPFIDPEGYRLFIAQYEKAFFDQLQKERVGGPPNSVSPAPPGLCPEDGGACIGPAVPYRLPGSHD